jgi:hypothetical protein
VADDAGSSLTSKPNAAEAEIPKHNPTQIPKVLETMASASLFKR